VLRARSGSLSRALARLALVAASLLLVLVLLEAGLQLGARWVGHEGRGALLPGSSWWPGRTRVLCMGDSNTYGIYVERDEAYPQQLEALWNARHPERPIQVLNMGYPGTNSSQVRRDLPRMLRTFHPDLVIAMVGANDYWTAPVAVEGKSASGPLDWLRRKSRVYKLFYMLARAFDRRELVVDRGAEDPEHEQESGRAVFGEETFELGYRSEEPGKRGGSLKLTRSLESLARQGRDAGTPLVLMTYPSHEHLYGSANNVIRAAAGAGRVPVVDLEAAFRARCPEPPCPELFFSDGHPTAAGYRVVAEELAAYLGRR
jgi:lysophospholipase L1-like esterase